MNRACCPGLVSAFRIRAAGGQGSGYTDLGVDGLEPRSFWRHFETLTRIARPSRHEEPAIEHVREWADRHGFELQQDAGRNLVIRVPASAGREAAPTVVLQGHLDMVCERDPSSPNDPAEGRIALVRDGDWLTADGTTLGADDGVAIAAMMALVEDESLPHGPLELLMTVAEEVGLEGANALDPALVTGSILINLDSEEDGKLTVGCAGSTDTWIRIEAPRGAGRRRRGDAGRHGRAAARAATPEWGSPWDGRTRSRCSAGLCARPRRRCRSGSSPFPAARAATRSRATRSRSARSRRDQEEAFRDAVATAAETIRDAFAKTDAGVSIDDRGGRSVRDAVDRRGHSRAARCRRSRADRSARAEPGLRRPRRDEHVARGGDHGGRPADAAQPLALVERLGAARGDRHARRRRTPRRWHAGGEAQLSRAGVRISTRGLSPRRRPCTSACSEQPPIVTAVHAGLETAVIGSKVRPASTCSRSARRSSSRTRPTSA